VRNYLQQNLNLMDKNHLIPLDAPLDEQFKYGYLAHHEGPTGVTQLLNGTLTDKRANVLLKAQFGGAVPDSVTSGVSSDADAYRKWLINYTNNKVNPDRFRNP
jgi:hypothetical protein